MVSVLVSRTRHPQWRCLAEERSKLDKSIAELDMLLEVLAEKDATIDDLNANVKKLRKMGFMFGVPVVF